MVWCRVMKQMHLLSLIVVVFLGLCLYFDVTRVFGLMDPVYVDRIEGETRGYNTSRRTKYILYWNTFYGNRMSEGKTDFSSCPVKNCYSTYDKSLLPVESYDAIVFHAPEFCTWNWRPRRRSPHQKYIYASMETPPQMCSHITFGGFYNWSMTHRLDSDIIWPYGTVVDKITNETMWPNGNIEWRQPDDEPDPGYLEAFKKKTKMVAWFVSKCHTASRREDLVHDLKRSVSVDIYGQCGDLKCDKKNGNNCYKMLEREYKFYLSFENSLCTDYVTEKLFNILELDIIPIVYGDASYSTIAPPNSVINAIEYPNMDHLGAYLIYLSRTPEEYVKYFWWKKYYKIGAMGPSCQLCSMLHDENAKDTTVYDDIADWEESLDPKCNPMP